MGYSNTGLPIHRHRGGPVRSERYSFWLTLEEREALKLVATHEQTTDANLLRSLLHRAYESLTGRAIPIE